MWVERCAFRSFLGVCDGDGGGDGNDDDDDDDDDDEEEEDVETGAVGFSYCVYAS